MSEDFAPSEQSDPPDGVTVNGLDRLFDQRRAPARFTLGDETADVLPKLNKFLFSPLRSGSGLVGRYTPRNVLLGALRVGTGPVR